MTSYADDRKWADRYIPVIKRIVGPHLLSPAPLEVDQQQAADLIVLRARDMTIACRVRRPGYAKKWPYDITIRSRRHSGAKTEFAKIVDGWGDWMFYGHAQYSEQIGFSRWYLIDLAALRAAMIRDTARGKDFKQERSNGDGTHFVVIDVRRIEECVIDSSAADAQPQLHLVGGAEAGAPR
jgi:hypothetical protein